MLACDALRRWRPRAVCSCCCWRPHFDNHRYARHKFRVSDSETSVASETRSKTTRKRISKKLEGWDQFKVTVATGGRHLSALQHEMKLRSAYSEIAGRPGSRDAKGEPVATSFHKDFSGTVDYIWHTGDLCAVRVLDTVPSSVLQRDKGLASQQWASDHLALACEFSFVPSKDTQEVTSS